MNGKTKNNKKMGRSFRRLAALALACLTAASLVPPTAVADDGAFAVDPATGTFEAWQWTRVDSQRDLSGCKNTPVMILYKSKDGTEYVIDGNSSLTAAEQSTKKESTPTFSYTFNLYGVALSAGVVFGQKNFVTLTDPACMTMTSVNYDTDNDCNKVTFYAKTIDGNVSMYFNYDTEFRKEGSEFPYPVGSTQYQTFYEMKPVPVTEWSVTTSEVSKSETSAGWVKIFKNVKGESDACVFVDGNKVYLEQESDWDDMQEFVLYTGERKVLSTIQSDFSSSTGQVVNINGDVILMEGQTMTIAPGSVLSIQGNLYNNGYIHNQGTIIVQKNACIQTFNLGDRAGGTIGCDGGDLLVMSGGRVITGWSDYDQRWGSGLRFQNGASLINYGTVVAAGNVDFLSGSMLDNRESGAVMLGLVVKSVDDGRCHMMTNAQLRDNNTYDRTFIISKSWNTNWVYELTGNIRTLTLDANVLLQNEGYLYRNMALSDKGANMPLFSGNKSEDGHYEVSSAMSDYSAYLLQEKQKNT